MSTPPMLRMGEAEAHAKRNLVFLNIFRTHALVFTCSKAFSCVQSDVVIVTVS